MHPYVFKNSVTKAAQYASTAQTLGSALFGSLVGLSAEKAAEKSAPASASNDTKTGWGKWAPAAYAMGGAILAGAAAGGAYYKREDLGLGYAWATDHMKYVRNLWDEAALEKRVNTLVDAEEQEGVTFRT